MQQPNKVVFLYSEMAGYFISCLKALIEKNTEVHVFHWPVNKEAPFQFDRMEGLHYYDRSGISVEELTAKVSAINPQAIVCSGWMDKEYVQVVKKFKGKVPTVVALDNHWTGSWKQRAMQLVGPLYITNAFSHAWVAGEPQAKYARKLGFKGDNLMQGFYSADLTFFKKQYEQNIGAKRANFPKRFVFVGRYMPHKGIYEMWDAFISLVDQSDSDWEMWCVGVGDDYEKRIEHPKIKHFGFVQPKDLGEVISGSGVFLLPSHFEPWGVVVHEFAAAGMPLLLSEAIGAGSAFLEEGKNGYQFKSNNKESLKSAMKKMMQHDHNELVAMGDLSHQKSDWIDPSQWSDKLLAIMK